MSGSDGREELSWELPPVISRSQGSDYITDTESTDWLKASWEGKATSRKEAAYSIVGFSLDNPQGYLACSFIQT